jgi:hypothetical protein
MLDKAAVMTTSYGPFKALGEVILGDQPGTRGLAGDDGARRLISH